MALQIADRCQLCCLLLARPGEGVSDVPTRAKGRTDLEGDNGILDIESAIVSKSFRDNQQSICKGLDTHFNATLRVLFDRPIEMSSTRYLKGPCPRDQGAILYRVLSCS